MIAQRLSSSVFATARWRRVWLLTLAVLGVHLLLVAWLRQHLPTLNGDDSPRIERFELAFVQELKPAEPQAMVSPPEPRRSPRAVTPVLPVAAAASAVLPDANDRLAALEPDRPLPIGAPNASESIPLPVPTALAATDTTGPVVAPAADASGEADPRSANAAQSTRVDPATPSETAPGVGDPRAKPFDWPPSTRLSYHLVGNYRGAVEGSARVEWLRKGSRYQVHLDVSIASVVSRRLSSEGVLGEEGLRPQRYEEITKAVFGTPRQRLVRFEGDRVILANGRSEQALPQVQDTASQFVQLAWMFAAQRVPQLPGERVNMPLALPGRMDRWSYRVEAEEELALPVGPLQAIGLRPERAQAPQDELSIQTWFAPSLQYLPVRILIRQDAQTFVDLRLSRLPQQVAESDSELEAARR